MPLKPEERCRAWTRASYYRERCRNAGEGAREGTPNKWTPGLCEIHRLVSKPWEVIPVGGDLSQLTREFIGRPYLLAQVQRLLASAEFSDEVAIFDELERRIPQEEPKGRDDEAVWVTSAAKWREAASVSFRSEHALMHQALTEIAVAAASAAAGAAGTDGGPGFTAIAMRAQLSLNRVSRPRPGGQHTNGGLRSGAEIAMGMILCECGHSRDDHRGLRPHICGREHCQCTGFGSMLTCSCSPDAEDERCEIHGMPF